MSEITVVIIAKNEELMLPGCLESLKGFEDVILVDTGSSKNDRTTQIAKNYGVKVYHYLKGGFSEWRNKGLELATGKWILYLDADERMTPSLQKEIRSVLNSPAEYSAYAIPRINIILGKKLTHGGWYPDYQKRLFLKSKLKKWQGDLHEEPVIEGGLGHFNNPMEHIKHETFSEMVEKTNKWSEIEAKLMFDANHPPMTIPRFLSAMFREFWHRMIVKRAFLDGTVGISFAMYQVFSRFVSYAKLWEMQVNMKKL